jgi:hypothetical protein
LLGSIYEIRARQWVDHKTAGCRLKDAFPLSLELKFFGVECKIPRHRSKLKINLGKLPRAMGLEQLPVAASVGEAALTGQAQVPLAADAALLDHGGVSHRAVLPR